MAIGWLIGVVLVRFITTLIHELGHAIPSLMFTDKEVAIHIGSYGDSEKSLKMNFGRLKAFFKLDILRWNIGQCQHALVKNFSHHFIIILGGPLFSLLIGIFSLLFLLSGDWSDGMVFIFACLILSSVFDFFVNITPYNFPIQMANGTTTYNDGTQLLNLIKEKKYPPEYFQGLNLIQSKKYAEAAPYFKKAIDNGYDKKDIRLYLVNSYYKSNQLDHAIQQINILQEKGHLKTDDYNLLGELMAKKGEHSKAIQFYNKYLLKNHTHWSVLQLRGYSYLQLSEYEQAVHDFNSAIIFNPKTAEAYNNRGLAKIRLGYLDEAFEDLQKSKSLDDGDAFLYLYLGYYYQKKNDDKSAFDNFQKAKEMKIDFHGIDYLIETTREL